MELPTPDTWDSAVIHVELDIIETLAGRSGELACEGRR